MLRGSDALALGIAFETAKVNISTTSFQPNIHLLTELPTYWRSNYGDRRKVSGTFSLED